MASGARGLLILLTVLTGAGLAHGAKRLPPYEDTTRTGHWFGVMDCQKFKVDARGFRPTLQIEVATDVGKGPDAKAVCAETVQFKRGIMSADGWVCLDRGQAHCKDTQGWVWTFEQARKRAPMAHSYLWTRDVKARDTISIFLNDASPETSSRICRIFLGTAQAQGDKNAYCVDPAVR